MEEATAEDIRAAKPIDKTIQDLAGGKKVTNEEINTATEWFLSDEPPEEEGETRSLEINVGGSTEGTQQWRLWIIQPVDGEVLRKIRRSASGSRAARRAGGEIDDSIANARIVIAGTVEPDIVAAAKEKGIADPATLVEQKFRKKPGLIGQLAGEILAASGYDDEDIREVAAAKRS